MRHWFAVLLLLWALPTEAFAANGRPSGCPARRWCGCWLAHHLGLSNRSLWLARNWARIGSPAHGPAPGVVAVWPHHVGIVTGVPGPGRIVLKSGNDGRAVRERERSSRGVIAWRRVGGWMTAEQTGVH